MTQATNKYETYSQKRLVSTLNTIRKNIAKAQTEQKRIDNKLNKFLADEVLVSQALGKALNPTPIEESKIIQKIKQAAFSQDELQAINAELEKDMRESE